MTIRISKKMPKDEVAKMLRSVRKRKQLNAKKFCGTIAWGEDGLKYQKRLRNEWD